jgi:hypothetical protein
MSSSGRSLSKQNVCHNQSTLLFHYKNLKAFQISYKAPTSGQQQTSKQLFQAKMPLRIADLCRMCPHAMFEAETSYYKPSSEALACCGDLVIYIDSSRKHFIAVCPDHRWGGIYSKHLYEVEGGIEVKCPYTGTSDGVFIKAYKLLRFLGYSCFGWSRALVEEMETDEVGEMEAEAAE